MKKLIIRTLMSFYQGNVIFAEKGEKLEVIRVTKENTTVLDKEGMTRKINDTLNNLVQGNSVYIESFK